MATAAKLAPPSPAEIARMARDLVVAERGERPVVTGQAHWSGYRSNSDADEMARIDGHFAKLAAMRAWDRRLADVTREMKAWVQ
jgi:hypothetical protein